MTPRKGYQTGRGNDPKPIFRDLVIAVSGFLGGEPWTDVNIARWVSLRQGTFSQQMNASVTHLVCSEAEVKSGSPRVQEALRRGCKSCKVVTRDWLEDSMHADRRLPEVQFSPVKVVRKERKKELHKLQVMKGNLLAERAVNTNLYHDYQDGTYFKYTVTITRDDEVNGVFGERYILLLQESNAKPHLYWFFAKFYKSKTNTHAHIYRPSTIPGSFEREFRYFKSFFEKKTGVPWDERLVRTGPADKNLFRYTSPTGGKPVGWVPAGFERPDSPPSSTAAQDQEENITQTQEEVEEEPSITNENEHEGLLVPGVLPDGMTVIEPQLSGGAFDDNSNAGMDMDMTVLLDAGV